MESVPLERIEADLLRVKLELERVLNDQGPGDISLIKRDNGSIRGRKFHVYNTLKRFHLKKHWKKDYVAEELSKIVVYTTSCGIVRQISERSQKVVELLKALGIKAEVRDLNLNADLLDEVVDRMGLSEEERGVVHGSLPLIYVNGNYFGNHFTVIELNERGELTDLLCDFQGRQRCESCGEAGYHLCSYCKGGKKSSIVFKNTNLRCAYCNEVGIVPCKDCLY